MVGRGGAGRGGTGWGGAGVGRDRHGADRGGAGRDGTGRDGMGWDRLGPDGDRQTRFIQGRGNFVRGQVCGENFVFKSGGEFFPTKFLLCNLGPFLLLVHPPWRRQPGVVALLLLLKILAPPKFHTTDCPQGPKGWGCRSFPCLMALHQNWRCVEIFPSRNCPQTKSTLPPPLARHLKRIVAFWCCAVWHLRSCPFVSLFVVCFPLRLSSGDPKRR